MGNHNAICSPQERRTFHRKISFCIRPICGRTKTMFACSRHSHDCSKAGKPPGWFSPVIPMAGKIARSVSRPARDASWFCPRVDVAAADGQGQALAFFSLHEGFGIPLLEAFAVRTPVICSNTTSLPEVGGDAVLSCDPTDVDAMQGLMRRILVDQICATAIDRARRNAALALHARNRRQRIHRGVQSRRVSAISRSLFQLNFRSFRS